VPAEDEQVARGATRRFFGARAELDARRHRFEVVTPLRDEIADARLRHAGRAHRFAELHGAVGNAIDALRIKPMSAMAMMTSSSVNAA
jgi:hypothetical protein